MTIRDAIAWSGSGATLSMFVAFAAPPSSSFVMASERSRPKRVLVYPLEDEARVLGAHSVVEYDAVFDGVPDDLSAYLTACLLEARGGGGVVAWFGFEGSFAFDMLFEPAMAPQIYALADSEGVAVADDPSIVTPAWRDRVLRAGQRLRSG